VSPRSEPPDRDARRISDIIEHLESIASELKIGRDAFKADRRVQKIVAYDLAIIGEAASKVSKRTQQANLQIPWTDLVEYRNDLLHEYQTLALDQAWVFARDVLPGLERRLRRIRVTSRTSE